MSLPDADPLFYLLAVVAVILLGFSKGGYFGLGVMSVPLMSLYVPPLQAVAILIPTVMVQDVLTVWTYRHNWSASNLKILIPSLTFGVAVGAVFAAAMSPAYIRLAVGIVSAAFVLRQWLGYYFERLAGQSNMFTGVVFGALGGFTTMIASAGGPAWQIHLLPQKLDKLTYAGTLTILFAASDVIKLPALVVLGQMTVPNFIVGTALIPIAVVANYAGLWLVRRTPTGMFYRIAYALMFVIALELIRGAVVELRWV
jgi:uncharacterized membrane protein YfcA